MRWLIVAACLLVLGCDQRQNEVTLVTTTSVRDSGLADHLFPHFEKETGIALKLVIVPTGQAFAIAARGDADALLTHDPKGEQDLVKAGLGRDPALLFRSRFVLIGPGDDPAGIGKAASASVALDQIRNKPAIFVSRGDDSGTYRKERVLWDDTAGGRPGKADEFYKSAGAGQGQMLNLAAGLNAYALTDEPSFLAFANKAQLTAFPMDDPALINPYGFLIAVQGQNPEGATRLRDWLLSDRARSLIDGFKVGDRTPFQSQK